MKISRARLGLSFPKTPRIHKVLELNNILTFRGGVGCLDASGLQKTCESLVDEHQMLTTDRGLDRFHNFLSLSASLSQLFRSFGDISELFKKNNLEFIGPNNISLEQLVPALEKIMQFDINRETTRVISSLSTVSRHIKFMFSRVESKPSEIRFWPNSSQADKIGPMSNEVKRHIDDIRKTFPNFIENLLLVAEYDFETALPYLKWIAKGHSIEIVDFDFIKGKHDEYLPQLKLEQERRLNFQVKKELWSKSRILSRIWGFYLGGQDISTSSLSDRSDPAKRRVYIQAIRWHNEKPVYFGSIENAVSAAGFDYLAFLRRKKHLMTNDSVPETDLLSKVHLLANLNSYQLKILTMVEHMSKDEIMETLKKSPSTVTHHITELLNVLELKDINQAIKLYRMNNVAPEFERVIPGGRQRLTFGEIELIKCILNGLLIPAIAQRFNTDTDKVKKALDSAFKKLEAKNLSDVQRRLSLLEGLSEKIIEHLYFIILGQSQREISGLIGILRYDIKYAAKRAKRVLGVSYEGLQNYVRLSEVIKRK